MSLSSFCLPDVRAAAPSVPPIAPSKQAQTGGIALPALLLAAVYAIPIAAALRPVADPLMDPDIWWHLRAGQWLCEQRAVPLTDPFSRYGADKPWIAYSWLYEVLVYRLYEAFGLAGIVLYRVVLSLAVTAALHRLIQRREPRFLVAIGLTATAALALSPLFSERPWLFTILFTILTLDVVFEVRAGRAARGMWLLPLVFVLWANLHIQFIYGLLLLGLACAAPRLDAWLTRSASPLAAVEKSRNSRRFLLLMGLCFLATLVNPYHVELYRVVVEYATQPGPFRCVNELRAMEFRETADWVVLFLGAAALFALGRRRRVSSFEFLLLFSAGVFAFRSRRDLWFLAAAAAVLLTSRRGNPAVRFHQGANAPRSPRCWFAVAMLLIVLIGALAWQRDVSTANLQRKVAGVFPVESAAIIAERGYTGPLYNDFNWGGFLIWSLPRLPVVLDGRTNLHGDERIRRIGNTWAAGPGWRDDPDLASAGVVLADTQSPLGCVLVLDERFQLVHEDKVARVFVRKQPAANAQREQAGIP